MNDSRHLARLRIFSISRYINVHITLHYITCYEKVELIQIHDVVLQPSWPHLPNSSRYSMIAYRLSDMIPFDR